MKTLTVGKEILDFKGNPIRLENEKDPITIKEVLLRSVGSCNFNEDGRNGKRNIIGRRLGEKLYLCQEPTIELEDSEFEMIKESLKVKIFSCLVMGPVEEEIERAEKEK